MTDLNKGLDSKAFQLSRRFKEVTIMKSHELFTLEGELKMDRQKLQEAKLANLKLERRLVLASKFKVCSMMDKNIVDTLIKHASPDEACKMGLVNKAFRSSYIDDYFKHLHARQEALNQSKLDEKLRQMREEQNMILQKHKEALQFEFDLNKIERTNSCRHCQSAIEKCKASEPSEVYRQEQPNPMMIGHCKKVIDDCQATISHYFNFAKQMKLSGNDVSDEPDFSTPAAINTFLKKVFT